MSYFDDVFEPLLTKEPKFLAAGRRSRKRMQIEKLRSGIWLSANGPIRIADMTDDHIRNALALVTRRDRDEVDRVAREVLGNEVARRGTIRDISSACNGV